MSDKGLRVHTLLEVTNKQGLKRRVKVSTLRERMKAALWTIGVEEVTELVAAWKKKFPNDKFGRETGRKWLLADPEPRFLQPAKVNQLGFLTGFDPNWIQTGEGDPSGQKPISTEAREMLQVYGALKKERQKALLSMAKDALSAQKATEPTEVETPETSKT